MSHLKVALLLSYICIASISAAIITPALPAIEQFYNLQSGALEWVVSIFLFGYVFGQLLYGSLANCYGRLPALRGGLFLNLIGIFICLSAVFWVNYPLLLLGRFITGLGAASGLCCTFILINEYLTPERAKQAMSHAIVSFTVGIGAAVSLGGVITQYLHWWVCFLLLLGHGVVMLFCTKLFTETLISPKAFDIKAIGVGFAAAIRNAQLVIFSLTVGLVSLFGYAYSATAPLYAQDTLHLTASEYGYWNLINMVGMFGSGFLGAALMKRYGPKIVLLTGLVLLIPAFISLAAILQFNIDSTSWFFVTTAVMYLFTGIIFPAASYFASNAIADKASASSVMSFLNMGSAMLGVIIIGYLPLSPIAAFFTVLMVFYLVVGLLSVLRCIHVENR